MDIAEDIIAVLGTVSIAGLWLFCMLGGLAALWETFGDSVEAIVEKLRR